MKESPDNWCPGDCVSSNLGFKKVAIIDDDQVILNLIQNYLERREINHIDQFVDGEEAWNGLMAEEYDLIILDWKLPSISGLALYNRIRSDERYRLTPILVVSGFLEKDDFKLLDEFPCTMLLEKPFTNGLFYSKLEDLAREFAWHVENEVLVAAFLKSVASNKTKIIPALKKLLKDAPNKIPLSLIAAKSLVSIHKDEQAEIILKSILNEDPDCIIALNEFGKIRLRVGDHQEALALMGRANKISGKNLERLCMLGEAELNLSNPKAAKKLFLDALEVDSGHQRAKSGVVVAKNMEALMGLPQVEDVTNSFASVLNTIGISFVRKGHYQQAIEQYTSAMPFLHSDIDSARLAFNLGLGFLRWGKLEQSLKWFQESQLLGKKDFKRSQAFISKIQSELLIAEASKVDQSKIPKVIDMTEGDASEEQKDSEESVIDQVVTDNKASEKVDFEEADGHGSITDHDESFQSNAEDGEKAA